MKDRDGFDRPSRRSVAATPNRRTMVTARLFNPPVFPPVSEERRVHSHDDIDSLIPLI